MTTLMALLCLGEPQGGTRNWWMGLEGGSLGIQDKLTESLSPGLSVGTETFVQAGECEPRSQGYPQSPPLE